MLLRLTQVAITNRVWGTYSGYQKDHAKLQEVHEALGVLVMHPLESLEGEAEEYKGREVCEDGTLFFTDKEFVTYCRIMGTVTVIEVREFDFDVGAAFEHVAAKQEGKHRSLETVGEREGTYNNKCHVHMAGQALSTYNITRLMEDACTDELQGNLDEGWRIIAACVQPDGRRPDYILGRYVPETQGWGLPSTSHDIPTPF